MASTENTASMVVTESTAAQSEAAALLAADPLLESPVHALLAAQVQQMFDKAGPMN